MTVCPFGGSVRADTVIARPLVVTVPTVATVQPGVSVVTGGVHPTGTSISREASRTPPLGAVYVNAIVFPAEALATFVVVVVTVPASAGGNASQLSKPESHCGWPA